jgi:membrane protein DedA with SNARE-associated domain
LVVPIVIVTVLGAVGTAFTPALAARHPLALIALEARDRNLVLARHVALVPFVLVGTARRLVSDPFFFLLGRFHGDRAVRWLEVHGGGRWVRATERAFHKAAYPMLVIFPGAVVGMPVAAFAVIVVVRTVAAVFLLRLVGDALGGPIDASIRFFDRYLLPATAVSVLLVVAHLLWTRWTQRRGG